MVGELIDNEVAAQNEVAAASTIATPEPAAAPASAEDTFLNNPQLQLPSLAGTSGKTGLETGMALDNTVETVTAQEAAQTGSNLGVDAGNVNVVGVGAPHPVVSSVHSYVTELRAIVVKQEQTPWIQRAIKDLQTFEEWVVQHFEELKRKL